jgi:hypothetical protein
MRNGYFCLDTPNRFLTEIHTADTGGGFIHPEHKIEYYPQDLQSDLLRQGFKINKKLGIRHMPNSVKSNAFDYTDFLFGDAFHEDVDKCYIQYYMVQK